MDIVCRGGAFTDNVEIETLGNFEDVVCMPRTCVVSNIHMHAYCLVFTGV